MRADRETDLETGGRTTAAAYSPTTPAAWRARGRTASIRRPSASNTCRLDGGSTLRLGVVQAAPQLVLLRPDEKLTFHFSEDTSTRLTSQPVAPEPAPASGTSPAAPAK